MLSRLRRETALKGIPLQCQHFVHNLTRNSVVVEDVLEVKIVGRHLATKELVRVVARESHRRPKTTSRTRGRTKNLES